MSQAISIDRRLNLVVPIVRTDETVLYVHSTPIRRETFKTYYLVLAKTFASLAQNGLSAISGPSVAAMLLEDVARNTARAPGLNWWDGPDGVAGEAGLLAEITRLSNAIVPTKDDGWGAIPLMTAFDQGLLTDEERSEVTNFLVFFTVVSLVAPRENRRSMVEGMAYLYDLQTTLSNCTEFASSSKTSTADANTGASAQA